ncbi:MAG: NAD(P)-dependent oxidoreductase [Candidatus Daviesbacteria bacterium]|nr:NAD(P)-dependent oxidoreductase [Candidatus Daviesbacteria bacterium]
MHKMKIVVPQDMAFYPDQIKRLKSLGETTFYEDIPTPEQWLERCKDADIICTGEVGMETKSYELKNKYFSLPMVGTAWLDLPRLKAGGNSLSNSPGCNKEAVSEWIIGMMIYLMRNFDHLIRITNTPKEKIFKTSPGLAGKNITILGKGNIGSTVGKICEALSMNVTYFQRGDDLLKKVKDADVVVSCLKAEGSTKNLLDTSFFNSLKKGSYFITITASSVYDIDAMFEALDKGILAGAADDSAGMPVAEADNPYYLKLVSHPKVVTTPHVAYNTEATARKANDIMIDNVENWIKGTPINIVI